MTSKRNFRKAGVMDGDHFVDALIQLQSDLATFSKNMESQIRQLLAALENGALVAFGFPTHLAKPDRHEPVPQFLIQRQFIDINKSEFGDGSYRYAKVRIFPAATRPEQRIGRPADKGRIFEIANTLAAHKIIYPSLPPKAQAAKIRNYGIRNSPSNFSETKPSDQTIRRHLKAFWLSKE